MSRTTSAQATASLTVATTALLAVTASSPAAGTQPFTSDGTFTVPAGVCRVTFEAFGGRGQDGAASTAAGGTGAAGRTRCRSRSR